MIAGGEGAGAARAGMLNIPPAVGQRPASHFDQSIRPARGFRDRGCHIVDRRAAGRAALVTAVMDVPVNDRAHFEPVDRLAEARAASRGAVSRTTN
jgi:hypothetical protein